MNKGSCCSTTSPVFGTVSVLDFGRSNRCVVVSHCCFNLHIPDDIWCGASFCMLICHLHIFFGEVSLTPMTHLKIRLFVFLLLSFKGSLYTSGNSHLSDVSFASIFFQFMAWHYLSQSRSLILMKSSLSIISFMDYAYDIVTKKSSPYPRSSMYTPIFFLFKHLFCCCCCNVIFFLNIFIGV